MKVLDHLRPSVLREEVNQWFDLNCDSPYMMLVSNVKEKICYEMNDEEKKIYLELIN